MYTFEIKRPITSSKAVTNWTRWNLWDYCWWGSRVNSWHPLSSALIITVKSRLHVFPSPTSHQDTLTVFLKRKPNSVLLLQNNNSPSLNKQQMTSSLHPTAGMILLMTWRIFMMWLYILVNFYGFLHFLKSTQIGSKALCSLLLFMHGFAVCGGVCLFFLHCLLFWRLYC